MNKYTLNNFLLFAVGAAIGSAVTWKLVKTKYEQIAQEEIDSVKEVFSKKNYEECISDAQKYEEIISENGYVNYSNNEKEEKGEEDLVENEPYIISPDIFGECDYETVSLTYYADKVLTDEMDEPVKDIDEVVGLESLNHFGDYENDSVFVRNDELKTDFEILRDTRKYSDVYR